MIGAIPQAEKASILQSFMVGTARRPAVVTGPIAEGHTPDAAILAALSAIAVERRFIRPTTDASMAPLAATFDPGNAALVPEATRRAMRTLFEMLAKNDDGGDLIVAAVELLMGFGWTLHPFDVAHMKEMFGSGLLTSFEKALPDVVAPSRDPAVDVESWEYGTPSSKVDLIVKMRGVDPAHAAVFLSERIAEEKPDVRKKLVESLAVGLSADDIPFLQGRLGDRSDYVRDAARDLLSRIPGTKERQDVLNDLSMAIDIERVGSSGSLRIPHHFSLHPATKARVTGREVAARLDLTVELLVSIVANSSKATQAFFLSLFALERDVASFIAIARHFNGSVPEMLAQAAPFKRDDRRRIVALIEPSRIPRDLLDLQLEKLRSLNEGPLPLPLARIAVECVRRLADADLMAHERSAITRLATVVPPELVPAFREAAGVALTITEGLYLDFSVAAHADAARLGLTSSPIATPSTAEVTP